MTIDLVKLSEKDMNDFVPERMRDVPFESIRNIIGKRIIIEDFELFESASAKYTERNKTGVHLVVVLEDDSKVRICTHAVNIVRAFKCFQKLNIPWEPTSIIIVEKQFQNGTTLVFQ